MLAYWAQTALIGAIAAVISLLYFKSERDLRMA